MWKKYSFFIILVFCIWSVPTLLSWSTDSEEISIYAYARNLSLLLTIFISVNTLFVMLSNVNLLINSKINRFLLLWMSYVLLIVFFTSDNILLFLRDIQVSFWWILSYFLFFVLLSKDRNGNVLLLVKKSFLILFIIQTCVFIYIRYTTMFSSIVFVKYYSSNTIFFVSLLLPFLLFIKRVYLRNLFLIVAFIVCLISFKRSVLIYAILSLIAVFYYQERISQSRKLIYFVAGIAVSLLLMIKVNDYVGGHIFARVESMEEDEGSGRVEIWEKVLVAYGEKPTLNQLFGSGSLAVSRDIVIPGRNPDKQGGLSAHNDYIEVLYDFGIVGLMLYLRFLYLLFRRIWLHKRQQSPYFLPLLVSFVIYTVMSFVSQLIIYPTYFAYLAVIWAMSESYISKRRKTLIKPIG